MPIATMTTRGRVTIPAAVRRRYGLVPGSRLDVIPATDDVMTVRTRVPTLAEPAGSLPNNGIRPAIEDSDDAIAAAVGEEVFGGTA